MSAWATALAVALAPTIAIIATYMLNRRVTAGVAGKVADVPEKLEQIHELVNSRMTEALERIAALERLLKMAPGDPLPPEKET